MTEQQGPFKARVETSGPYLPGKQEAWFYRDGTSIETHAQVMLGGQLYHVTVRVPAKSHQRKSPQGR